MKNTIKVLGIALVLVLALSTAAFASNGNGPAYEVCVKDFMDPADVARFEQIIAEYQAAMEPLRGNPNAFDQRTALKVEKRDALVELVPDDFKERFSNFNTEKQGMRHQGGKNLNR
ncbi:MAG: hypothetical protein FJZ15_04785 [Candidatus Omnitrophica bacterium]|nr:hypothetical protein [Candidatus Omnitrophota bacterium]